MVIQHNIAAVNAYRNLSSNSTSLNKNLEKLSSGYRINRAADDAAGLAISEQMRSKINGLDQATKNANDAIGLIQTADGALAETQSMLQRMVTLSTQAANGTYNTAARANIDAEMKELNEEIDRIATSTDYNGVRPLLASKTGTAAQKVTSGVVATKITLQIGPTKAETLDVSTKTMTASALGIKWNDANGLQVFGSKTQTAATQVSHANAAIKKINDAIDKVSTYRANLGAKQNRLEHTINNLKTTSENMTSAESRIRDTDMAEEIAAYTKNNVLNQAAQSMLAQANQLPQQTLQLLQ